MINEFRNKLIGDLVKTPISDAAHLITSKEGNKITVCRMGRRGFVNAGVWNENECQPADRESMEHLAGLVGRLAAEREIA